MGKYTKSISESEQNDLLINLLYSLQSIKNPEDAAYVVRDLLSGVEVLMIAKRLKIAELLAQELTYSQIKKLLKTSEATIAKMHAWMEAGGQGFRLIFKRKQLDTLGHSKQRNEWDKHKRKYSSYYWPQLLLEEFVKTASKKQVENLLIILRNLRNQKI